LKILTGVGFSWEKSSYGSVPPGAITSGKTVHGEWLFIGRTTNGHISVRLGKVHPSHACIYVTHNGRVEAEAFYEVLVQRKERLEIQQPIDNSTTNGRYFGLNDMIHFINLFFFQRISAVFVGKMRL
jgi:hypothetical protein